MMQWPGPLAGASVPDMPLSSVESWAVPRGLGSGLALPQPPTLLGLSRLFLLLRQWRESRPP